MKISSVCAGALVVLLGSTLFVAGWAMAPRGLTAAQAPEVKPVRARRPAAAVRVDAACRGTGGSAERAAPASERAVAAPEPAAVRGRRDCGHGGGGAGTGGGGAASGDTAGVRRARRGGGAVRARVA
jgi:hypothetical protein